LGTQQSTFRLDLVVPRKIEVEGRKLDRDDFLAALWDTYGNQGLLGVHEGTLLTEQATEQGFDTESWTIDAAEAPRERDWVGAQEEAEVALYFASEAEAEAARGQLVTVVKVSGVFEQKVEDWDADWKKSFLNASDGVFIEPFWRILPAWVDRELPPGERALKINPGAGFGTGTHETTQLCLKAIGECAKGRAKGVGHLLRDSRALDFGSGSGILAIGAALLGAQVDAVEIDELAIDNARENARINGVLDRIEYSKSLGGARGPYPLVIANILRPVLVEFAPELVRRLAPGGCLILSGLVQNDVAEVGRVFSALIGSRPQVSERAEWRGMVWG
jgi:ribosomal protein L11 methyltransferase